MSDMNDDMHETAGIGAPPPLLFAVPLACGLLLGRGASTDARGLAYARWAGIASIASGLGIGVAAIAAIRGTGSNVDPYKPTTALATSGVFQFSRNPAYVGATAIYLGIALANRSLPALAFLPISLALVDHLVVDREERYLEARFGETYRDYRKRVARWF